MTSASALRTSMVKEHSLAIEVTPVPPFTVDTLKIVKGSSGSLSSAIRAIVRPMHMIGLTMPKAPMEWPPGPRKMIRNWVSDTPP